MTEPTTLLTIDDLQVVYGRRRRNQPAVTGVHLRIEAGRTVALVGESGSGKSTIGRAILGLVEPSAGTITFDGQDITRRSNARRRELSAHLQVVFQNPYGSLNPRMTVGALLSEPLRANGGMSRAQATARVSEMLSRVGLPADTAGRYPAQFSGGQRQRIAIARAFVGRPRLVVCDEALSALDLSVQASILNLLTELQRETGVSYLFITHDLGLLGGVADDVVVLYQGHVVETGRAAAVSTSPRHPYTRALLDSVLVPDVETMAARRHERAARRAARSAITVASTASGCVFAARCPYVVEHCLQQVPALRRLASADELTRVACHRAEEIELTVTSAGDGRP